MADRHNPGFPVVETIIRQIQGPTGEHLGGVLEVEATLAQCRSPLPWIVTDPHEFM
jgi:hypothetical protein